MSRRRRGSAIAPAATPAGETVDILLRSPMKNFYWIDSFEGYPDAIDELIKSSLDTYDDLYRKYVEALGYALRGVQLEDVQLASGAGDSTVVRHPDHGDLLAAEAAAYVGLIHPDLQKERKQESLYRLFASSKNVRL